jgi:putative ABC transport system permease protein
MKLNGTYLRFKSILIIAIKRCLAQRGLTLAASLGIVAAVGLAMSIPIYADAVYQRLMNSQVSPTGAEAYVYQRPPLSFMFEYPGSWEGVLDWDKLHPVDAYLSTKAGKDLGLPVDVFVRFFKTSSYKLFPANNASYPDIREPLNWVNFGFSSDFASHVTLVEGKMPQPQADPNASPVEVLVGETFATKMGVQTGDEFVVFAPGAGTDGRSNVQFPVRVVGIWKPNDVNDSYWFYSPTSLEEMLIVPEETFVNRVTPYLKGGVELGLWYLVLQGKGILHSDSSSFLSRITMVQTNASNLLPKIRLALSPIDVLVKYQRASKELTFLLYAYCLPILLMILAFIGLVAGMAASQRRGEIAILRSRGATLAQIMGIETVQALLIGLLGLGFGIPLSMGIASMLGRARSFLDFSSQRGLDVSLSTAAWEFGLITVAMAVLAQLLPALSSARLTVVTYKQDRARQLTKPWWQRAWLDVLLLIPAAYGFYLLRRQGSVALPLSDNTASVDPFQNPLLLLVPSLGIFALTLLLLRLLPYTIRLIAWLLAKTRSIGILMAARYLARSPGQYNAPLILLVLTLSLSTFTASLAQTLDHHLTDQAYYKTGADLNIVELGEGNTTRSSPALMGGSKAETTDSTQSQSASAQWRFLPVSEHLKVPGVVAATRIGEFKVLVDTGKGSVPGVFMGIDRLDFPKVAFWRWDFAPQSLGALMNDLAQVPDGVLVPRSFMAKYGLNTGDLIQGVLTAYGQKTDLSLTIAGGFDLFPSWYPDDGVLLVGSLDHVFEQLGSDVPYDVWLKTNPGVDFKVVARGVNDLYHYLVTYDAAPVAIEAEQDRPSRQGLFGVLSVGFTAAAVLTVLGFLLYAIFSFRQRFIEMGMLRAVGLSAFQMMILLASELAFLIFIGLAAGTGLGIWVSNFFIPYLQIGAGATAYIPPYLVQIDWSAVSRIYILFGLIFVAALGALGVLLLRMKIFQAVKLGETV